MAIATKTATKPTWSPANTQAVRKGEYNTFDPLPSEELGEVLLRQLELVIDLYALCRRLNDYNKWAHGAYLNITPMRAAIRKRTEPWIKELDKRTIQYVTYAVYGAYREFSENLTRDGIRDERVLDRFAPQLRYDRNIEFGHVFDEEGGTLLNDSRLKLTINGKQWWLDFDMPDKLAFVQRTRLYNIRWICLRVQTSTGKWKLDVKSDCVDPDLVQQTVERIFSAVADKDIVRARQLPLSFLCKELHERGIDISSKVLANCMLPREPKPIRFDGKPLLGYEYEGILSHRNMTDEMAEAFRRKDRRDLLTAHRKAFNKAKCNDTPLPRYPLPMSVMTYYYENEGPDPNDPRWFTLPNAAKQAPKRPHSTRESAIVAHP